jgi:hypothetical protein
MTTDCPIHQILLLTGINNFACAKTLMAETAE